MDCRRRLERCCCGFYATLAIGAPRVMARRRSSMTAVAAGSPTQRRCVCMPCVYDSVGSWCGCVRRDGWAPRAEWFHSRTITRAGVSPACASASLRHAARLIARRVLTRSTSVLRVNALNGCSIAPNWSPKSRHRFPALLRMLCLRFLRALPLLLSLPQLNHRLPWCAHAASPGEEVQAGTGAKSPGRLGFY